MDYLEAVASFPNIGYQLICWLCTTKKPALMLMLEFMQCQVQLLSYLEGGFLMSNDGSTHGTREERTNLLCTAQGA
jgi:hypothetical protein